LLQQFLGVAIAVDQSGADGCCTVRIEQRENRNRG
jgi:hypothetical protein